jgi:hypothetical protein
MTALTQLWLPILLSAVAVFLASSAIHMLPLWHKNDYPPMPNEDRFRQVVGPLAIPVGEYMVPRSASMEEMKSPEFAEKIRQGPVMVVTVWPNVPFLMGRTLSLWFVYIVVTTIFAAYIASRALSLGATYIDVFRFVGATAFMGYTLALWQVAIWYGRSMNITVKATVDGLIYSLLTAGMFGWLWPQ